MNDRNGASKKVKISISEQRRKLKPEDRLIISLDTGSKETLVSLCRRIGGKVSILKIGLELIYNLGFDAINIVRSFGYKIFLDSKLLDIPNTVRGAISGIANLKPYMVTMHTLGGEEMLSAAVAFFKQRVASIRDSLPPLLFGVTVLTSLNDRDLSNIGFRESHLSLVCDLASIARKSGLDGVICSPNEVSIIREKYGDNFYIATPGIRLPEDLLNDQKRVGTPRKAISSGADFIIVGRSITSKKDIGNAIDRFLDEISGEV
ncbi:MAG: orotidine-5'-phosphate decarboxylase [Actinobacteria bacterium]|nr:orotidine-5'-phosphate decarboxylase [Actinomycetota bacterium]